MRLFLVSCCVVLLASIVVGDLVAGGYRMGDPLENVVPAGSVGGCLIRGGRFDYVGETYTVGDCFGQWSLDGSYVDVNFQNYGYYNPYGPAGPVYSSYYNGLTGNSYSVYKITNGNDDIASNQRVFLNDDGTAVAFLALSNIGNTEMTVTVQSAPAQRTPTPSGTGWHLGYYDYNIRDSSNGDNTVDNSDTWFTNADEYGFLTTSNRGMVDNTATTQAVAYNTVNPINGGGGESEAIEAIITHTITIPADESRAILTFFQVCDAYYKGIDCEAKAANLADEEAIFNAGYVSFLDATRLSSVVNYDAVALATGVFGGDPHMTPLTGTRRTQDIHGRHGDVVTVMADSDLVLNMQLKQIEAFAALDADATYIEAFGLVLAGGHQLEVRVADGLGYEVTLDGRVLEEGARELLDDNVRITVSPRPAGKLFKGWFSQRYGQHQLQAIVHVVTEHFNIELYPVYKDYFTNWQTQRPSEHTLLETHSFLDMDLSIIKHNSVPRGVLGETAHPERMRAAESLDERVGRYTVASLFDTTFQ